MDVPGPADSAFDLFTRQPTRWWPRGHPPTRARQAVVFEPCLGGR
ncbi:hypothetical protein ACF09H_10890 [Streptomyces sp. NPDC014983]